MSGATGMRGGRAAIAALLALGLIAGSATPALANDDAAAPAAETQPAAEAPAEDTAPAAEPVDPAPSDEPAAEPPAIVEQPDSSIEAAAGDDIEIDVVADGAVAYQWQRLEPDADPAIDESWSDLDGEENPTALTERLRLTAVDAAAQTSYRVAITGADGSVLHSDPSVLVVLDAEAPEDPADSEDPAETPEDAETGGAAAGTPAAEPPASRAAAAASGLKIDAHPENVTVAKGSVAKFAAKASGGEGRAEAQWQRSTSLNASTAPQGWIDLAGENLATLEVQAGSDPHVQNRWYRVVFTDAGGAKVTSNAAKLSISASAAPQVTQHPDPLGQTVAEGRTASFSAAASGENVSVRWQRTDIALPNGDPDDDTWQDIPDATSTTYTLTRVRLDDHGAFFRAGFSNSEGEVASRPGELRVEEWLDTNGKVTVSGESYGPVQPNTPFSVSAANAVVQGGEIVITGENYFATDKKTGSVANFMIDATYSGDPNTLTTTRTVMNPVTNQPFADKRSHGIAKAGSDGKWSISIPWPNQNNTTKDKAFFDENWAPGTQHTVRILTGSLLTGDYQRGITVRFTVVEAKTGAAAPAITSQPRDAETEGGEPVTFTAEASGVPAPTVQWQTSPDGRTWTDVKGAAKRDYTLRDPKLSQNGHRFRAVFANASGSATSDPAVLRVTSQPIEITGHPRSTSVQAGDRAVFTAAGKGPELAVHWQVSEDDGASWRTVRGATATTYAVERPTAAESGNRYRAVFTNPAWPDGEASDAATLTVTERDNVREHCGLSYGPGKYAGEEFCFTGPEKVVAGEPIVLRGTGGFLASDGATGSVVNFFFDSLYSGDPNTLYTKKLAKNPVTGKDMTDRRTNAVVQAKKDGSWTVTIPWPTTRTVSPSSDGKKNFTAAELQKRFASGTTHGIRLLSGSLLSKPVDLQRGATLFFTVVDDLADPVTVKKPIYKHQTYTSKVAGDSAVAWVPSEADSGSPIPLTGTGWKTKDGKAGSTIALRLKNENGKYYQRAGRDSGDPHEVPSDPTVWRLVHVGDDGVLDTEIDLPRGVTKGSSLSVELSTSDDGTALGDVERPKWTSQPITIDGTPWTKPIETGCTAAPAEATYELAPGMQVPAAQIGGSIRLVGKKWCNSVTGKGSYVAIKINDGALSHKGAGIAQVFNAKTGKTTGDCKADICKSNKTIWHVIEADDQGNFDVNIPMPTRSNTTPGFSEGAYTLRIMTGTLAGDPFYGGKRESSRTMQSPDFTVVCETCSIANAKPAAPTLAPDPLHVTNDLTESKRGGVQLSQEAGRWIVTVPKAKPEDWVYVNVYQGSSPRFPWGAQWYQVDANRRVVLPTEGVRIPTGTNKVSVQNRKGGLLGWTTATVAEPQAPAGASPVTAMFGPRFAPSAQTAAKPKPDGIPDKPVSSYEKLTRANAGDVSAKPKKGELTVTLPGVDGGDWVFLFLYTEQGRIVPVDWVQVGTDHKLKVDIGKLPTGTHKLAFVDEDGELIGWVTVKGGEERAAAAGAGSATAASGGALAVVAEMLGDDWGWTLVLSGLALLLLAGSAVAMILLRTPVRPPGGGGPPVAMGPAGG